MDKTIVVGLDTSEGSAGAMAWALDLVAGTGARVIPVHAWEYPALSLLPFPAGLPVPPPEAMQEDADLRASRLIERSLPPGGGVVGVDVAPPVVREGSAARVLCAEADKAEADLLVVGSRGLGGVRSTLSGSVSTACAHRSTRPVAIVPTRDGAEEPKNLVVVGVDGSAASDAAIAFADTWMPEDATLLLVHAWNLPVTLSGMVGPSDMEAIERAAETLLSNAEALVQHHNVETLIKRGDPRVELEDLAVNADALVLGTKGHSAIERFLLGSVAAHTVHHLKAPSVLVPPPGDDD